MSEHSEPDSARPQWFDDDGGGGALRTIARSGSANVGGALIGAAANFLLIVLIARWWAPEEAGVMFAATSVLLIAIGLCHLGVDQSLVRFLAWNTGRGDATRNRSLTFRALVPVMILAIAVATAGWFGATPLQRSWGALGDSSEAVTVIRTLAVALPVAVLYEQLLAITRGYSRMRATVIIERILRPCLQVLFVIVAAQTVPTVPALALAWVAPYPICLALAALPAWDTIRTMPRSMPKLQQSAGTMSEFWRFTAPRGAARLAQIGIQRADIVIVAALAGPAAAAIYTAATRFLVLGQMATGALQQVSEPQLAKLLGADNLARAAAIVRTMTLWSTALAVPLYVTIAVHADALLHLIFGPEYAAGSPLLRLLCAAMIIGVLCGPVDVLLLMAGRSTLSLINTVAALVTSILLCLLLVPSLSYLGAGIAWAAAILLKNCMACIQVWRHLRVMVFTWQQARWAVMAIMLFAPAPILLTVSVTSQWVPIALSMAIGGGYLAWTWVNRSKLLRADGGIIS